MSSSKLRSKKRTRWKFLTLCRLRGRVEIAIGKWRWKRKIPKNKNNLSYRYPGKNRLEFWHNHYILNYRVLNDPSARGPKECQHHVPTTEENGHISVDYAMIGASLEDDPTSLKEAKARSDWPKWKEAMDTEIDQLTKRGTYKMVDLPPDRKAISSKWVFRIKQD